MGNETWPTATDRQEISDALAPMIGRFKEAGQKISQFNDDYPVVSQVAQLVNRPYNTAAGLYGIGQAVVDKDPWAGVGSALSMIPLLSKFREKSALAGTKKSVDQLRYLLMNGRMPSAGFANTVARRVVGDAGVAVQASELGEASFDQTQNVMDWPSWE